MSELRGQSVHEYLEALKKQGFVFFESGLDALSAEFTAARTAGFECCLLPSLSCDRVLAAALSTGMRVELVDCASGALVPSLAEYQKAQLRSPSAKNLKTAVVLICHWGIWPNDLARIVHWAEHNNLYIIFDLASSAGLLTQWDHASHPSVISFGREKPVELSFGGAAHFCGREIERFPKIAYDQWSYKILVERIRQRHQEGPDRHDAFMRLSETTTPSSPIDVGILHATAAATQAIRAVKCARQRRNTERFAEASYVGGWLPFAPIDETMEYATRLIGLVPRTSRDEIVTRLRAAGLWIGLESGQHLGAWIGGQDLPNADRITGQCLSFITSQASDQAELCVAVLRHGL